MTSPKLPPNIIIKRLLVTDLSQQLKKQRDFLKWMMRRHKDINPDQSEAFGTGARIIDEIRQDLLDGLFDAEEEEVFTEEAPDVEDVFVDLLGNQVPPLKNRDAGLKDLYGND